MITEDLRVASDPEIIMFNLKTFYGTLYKSISRKTESECRSYLDSLDIPKPSDDENIICEGKLTTKECWMLVTRSMGADESPGNDVLSK